MKSFVLNKVHIIDPSRDLDEIGTIIVEDGIILAAGSDAINQGYPPSCKIRDCKGLVAIPGLVDARVTLNGPPDKYADNIVNTSREAASGGITSIILMPFISSLVDEYTIMKLAWKEIQQNSLVNVYPTASLTFKMEGKKINEIRLLQEQGVVNFTHGPLSICDTQVLFNSMKYAHMFNAIVALDTHDYFTGANGNINEGFIASCLGLPCIPTISETVPLTRDLLVAQYTGVQYHASVISIPQSVSILNHARENKVSATCGISINNLILNENDVGMYNNLRKVLPPLRSEEDRIAMIDALAKGDIDIIVSDHNPRHDDTKNLHFTEASFGSIGLETMLSAALRLFHESNIPLKKIIKSMSTRPSQIFNIPGGTLKPGAKADIVLIDLDHQWIAKKDNTLSSYKNMAFDNESFSGKVVETYIAGKSVYTLES
ncbi:MAG: dihydroorotase [Candidatus Liberibacter europaeus]|uniref:Dihydroorotase n=1 Tax=Candidatus Liberibacter europaeus TaxID=744859 RepID=A0A2T4VXX1_9HYPH|nr:dihydroorotase [Candidatus Liberibacter europaeus]PTL86626.1 MAG: dihydroorotase [Candidatus Liberibacter europaeus]